MDDLSTEDLAARLAEGDMRVLLMVLVHMSGDLSWLEEPFRPKRDVRLIPAPDAGLSEDARRQVVDALAGLLRRGAPAALVDPGNETLQRMMSVCLGEEVPGEYAPLVREEMRLTPRAVQWTDPPARAALGDAHVLIVGAGVSGIALAVNLKALGIPFTIVEQNSDVGGTWFVNRYPGCGVDTPNHAYAFSFGSPYRWSRYFSPRAEIQAYLAGVAKDFNLYPHIRFETQLTGTRWDEAGQAWMSTLVSRESTEHVASRFLVSAIGQLSDPSVPRIEGAEDFRGPIFHSSVWPDGLEVEGKRIAVIGTGATAMQLVPTIAGTAASVAVYQRTPQWSRPIPGYSEIIGDGAQWLLERVPFYAEWFRFNMFWRYGDGLLPFLRKDPDWPHGDRSVNRINERHRLELVSFIQEELKERPDLLPKCVPTYPPYGKRILLDNGWYRTLLKPNVELVDTPIDGIEENGVRAADGSLRAADIVVYSTGFKVTELAARLNIVGKGGKPLAEAWADENPTAYLGLSVPGFPNFFSMLGPSSGPAHGGSVVFQAECQSRFITSCIVQMVEQGIASIDVRQEVHDDYVRQVDAEHETLIWTHPGMSTYYRNRHGRVFSVMPWRFVDYWAMTHDPDLSRYSVVQEREEAPPAEAPLRSAQDRADIVAGK